MTYLVYEKKNKVRTYYKHNVHFQRIVSIITTTTYCSYKQKPKVRDGCDIYEYIRMITLHELKCHRFKKIKT